MGTIDLIKSRFDKLQKASEGHSLEEQTPVVKNAKEEVELELKASSRPDIHEKLRKGTSANYDWKKQFKQLVAKPSLESGRSKLMTEVEWSLQAMTDSSTLMSFTQSTQLESSLKNLSLHLERHSIFWKMILRDAEHVHINYVKNKVHLGIRYNALGKATRATIKRVLEREYISEANSLKTFHLNGSEDWMEIVLELNTEILDRRAGEASL